MSTGIPPTFQERVLNAADTCSNCYGRIREEHEIVPVSERKRNRTYPTQQYTRYERRTSVEHVPDTEPAHSHATFCDCGSASAFDRHRDEIVQGSRFRELLKTALYTVERKGVSVSREHAIRKALRLGLVTDTRFPVYTTDMAIAKGIEYGVSMATVSRSTQSYSRQTLRAD
jgi:hypothetical protein